MSQGTYRAIGSAAHNWWAANIQANTGAAKKTRAELRRATRPSDVLALEATHKLHATLIDLDVATNHNSDKYPLRLALVAAVVAGIDDDSKAKLAQTFGQVSGDSRALSQLRFQRLLAAPDDWELVTRVRRGLPLIKRRANVSSVGADLFFWNESIRNRWCFEYFGSTLNNDSVAHATEDDASLRNRENH